MTSTVVFDITQAGYKSYTFPAFGLIFVAIGAVILFFHFINKRKTPPGSKTKLSGKRPWFFYFYFGFSCIWTITSFHSTYSDYKDLRTAYEHGQCKLAEGRVENFKIAPKEKRKSDESFDVGDAHFYYANHNVSAGFNTSSIVGGPMKEGLYVRIHHCGNDIARLEIVDDVKPKN
ncbi:hypothetical protein [Undibacterium umbellatum]|uniref:Uncharacterized protein n=1 Tax=Undibacterium umbellatum TaxID=2762300 RepID=A0ABR6Z2I2_9BURK|nr:hypothetical protein [Undibacterium umbellatum]MBC3905938.1 hypothetical protein [Undibacterium umbellatum]